MLNSLQAHMERPERLGDYRHVFFAGHRRVTGHLCGSSVGEQSGLVCKQSFRSYFSHQFKNSLIIHLGKTPKKLMSLNLIKTQLNFTSIFLDQNNTKFKY